MDDGEKARINKLFNDNLGLVSIALEKFGSNEPDMKAEAFTLFTEYLWEACFYWDPTKEHTFSTYALKVMKNNYVRNLVYLTRNKRCAEQPPISLEKQVFDTDDITIQDTIADPETNYFFIEPDLNKLLTDDEKKVYNFMAQGYTLRSAAKELGYSYETVRKHYTRIKKKLCDNIVEI